MSTKKQQAALQAEETIAIAKYSDEFPEEPQPVSITVWADDDMYDMLTEFAKDYNEETLNQVTVEGFSSEFALSLIEDGIRVNVMPADVFVMTDIDLKEIFQNNFDGIANLSERINADDFMEYKISNCSFNGEIMAYPIESSPMVMFIRQDVLTDKYIDLPEMLTWEVFIKIGKRLKELCPDKYLLPPASRIATVLLHSCGKAFYNENICESNESETDFSNNVVLTCGVRSVMTLLKRLIDAGITAPETINVDSLIAEGKIIALFGGIETFTKINDLLDYSSESTLRQRWKTRKIPESDIFNKNVFLWGRSMIVKGNLEEKVLTAIDFLNYCFGKSENGTNEKALEFMANSNILTAVKEYFPCITIPVGGECFDYNGIETFLETAEVLQPLWYGKWTKDLESIFSNKVPLLENDTINNVYRSLVDEAVAKGYDRRYFKYKLDDLNIEFNRRNFSYGDRITKDDLTVTAYYDDEYSEVVTDYDLYPDTPFVIGDNFRIIEYTSDGDTQRRSINVEIKKELLSITVETEPNKKYYINGEDFVSDGLTVKARYNDGTITPLDISAVEKPSIINPNHI